MFDYRYDIHQPTRKLWVILHCIYMFMLISLCVAEVSQQTSSFNQARRYPEDDIVSSVTTESTNIDTTNEDDEQARSLAANDDDFIVSVEVSSDGTQQQLDGINAYTQMSDHDLNMYAGKVMDELHRRGLIATAPAFDDSMFTRSNNVMATDDSNEKERRKLAAGVINKYDLLDDDQLAVLSQYHTENAILINAARRLGDAGSPPDFATFVQKVWQAGQGWMRWDREAAKQLKDGKNGWSEVEANDAAELDKAMIEYKAGRINLKQRNDIWKEWKLRMSMKNRWTSSSTIFSPWFITFFENGQIWLEHQTAGPMGKPKAILVVPTEFTKLSSCMGEVPPTPPVIAALL